MGRATSILKQVAIKAVQDTAIADFTQSEEGDEPDRYWEDLIAACCEAHGLRGIGPAQVEAELARAVAQCSLLPGKPTTYDIAYHILMVF